MQNNSWRRWATYQMLRRHKFNESKHVSNVSPSDDIQAKILIKKLAEEYEGPAYVRLSE